MPAHSIPQEGLPRVCLVYDCLYPCTVGGAERWYRNLAERLVAEGYAVTYLTLRQWPRGRPPELAGAAIVSAGPRMALYDGSGRRRVLPPLVFGLGVLLHLLRRGRRYDVVHTASFPFFSLLAAGALRRRSGFRLIVDWHELWGAEYWRTYLGPVGGRIGWAVERLCLRIPQRAFCFARMTLERLRAGGVRGEATVLTGEYAGEAKAAVPAPARKVVLFAGRHIPEKRVPALVDAFAVARAAEPELRLEILGDGPERAAIERRIEAAGLSDGAEVLGFVEPEELHERLRSALCLVLPSEREGYGRVVVEASALGVPSVVVPGPNNAAAELVEDGRNGVIAPSAAPGDLAAAILKVLGAGDALRRATAEWFDANAADLTVAGSFEKVMAAYRSGPGHPSTEPRRDDDFPVYTPLP